MEKSRKIALDILNEVIFKGAYSNIVLNNQLNKSNLIEKDKALITEIVYGTIKYKITIDTIIKKYVKKNISDLDKSVLNLLRMSIYQMRYLDKIPNFAVVNEAVDISKKYISVGASKFVNAVLRSYLRGLDDFKLVFKNKIEEYSYTYSFEPWMIKLFINQYGEELGLKIMEGLNFRSSLTVRVNSIKADYNIVWEDLENQGYSLEEGFICPEAINILKGSSIEKNSLFNEGYITVQDESAMLIAPSMNLSENLKVLDLCSAPGGKTTHIAELMNNSGEVLAFDIHENKLSLIKSNLKRLGLKNVKCDVMDATVFNEELKEIADRVLIDVPCSGLGIIRKKPEIKWNKNIKDINSIIETQRKIMINAAKYAKKNGVILYSTCTLNKNENEDNIKWFLKEFPNYELEPIFFGKVDNLIYSEEGMLTILPNRCMDGFFLAKLRRLS